MKQVILITGASTGLGASLAAKAAAEGHTVYATMRNVAARTAIDAEMTTGTATVLPLDVQDTTSVQAVVDQIIAEQGRIDVLIANAGVGYARTTEQATEDDINRVMDTNVMGVIRSVKSVIPHMRKQRSGRVIAISSVGGLVGQPLNEIYCASKFAVEGYIESLATYVGPYFGIHFTTVQPGGISTEFANSALKQFMGSGGMIEDEYLPLIQKYLGNRDGRADGVFQTPSEVAQVILDVMGNPDPPIRLRTSAWAEAFSALKTQADPDGKKLQAQVIRDMLGEMPKLND